MTNDQRSNSAPVTQTKSESFFVPHQFTSDHLLGADLQEAQYICISFFHRVDPSAAKAKERQSCAES